MRCSLVFTIPLAGILAVLSVLHAHSALGGRWGKAYAVPVVRGRRSFNPTPLAAWVVCGLLGGAAILVVAASPRRLPLFDVGLRGLAGVFALTAIGSLRCFGPLQDDTGDGFCPMGHVTLFAAMRGDRSARRRTGAALAG